MDEIRDTPIVLSSGAGIPLGEFARVHYGARGWVVHLMTDVYGFTEPGYGTHGAWPMSTPWLCRHLWES